MVQKRPNQVVTEYLLDGISQDSRFKEYFLENALLDASPLKSGKTKQKTPTKPKT